ncbi:MAG: hypothetical protein KAG92_07460, partial [Deltaproteobacteria bacterium]|nr:hypothetical protein [Deltaproteobacteria bacterium]
MKRWWDWLMKQNVECRVNGRLVLLGDHTKTPKDGRRIPAVQTLHQDSETGSKPSFFRGHHWGCVALLVKSPHKYFAAPLEARIHEGLEVFDESYGKPPPKTVRIVQMARKVVAHLGDTAYLVLDAYFSVGSVFNTAAEERDGVPNPIHILTRAKKNAVAYLRAPKKKKGTRGPQKQYGKKIKIMKLFDCRPHQFNTAEVTLYGKREEVRYLVLNLLWKPVKGEIRFILVESSRGRIVLMASELDMDPLLALELYTRRVTIEVLFDALKNTQGAMAYHFWSQSLNPASRRPRRNDDQIRDTTNIENTRKTLGAIEKFVNLHLLVIGVLQLMAIKIPGEVKANARCWLRTVTSRTPSEFVTRTSLANLLKRNLNGLGEDPITQVIREKQKLYPNAWYYEDGD